MPAPWEVVMNGALSALGAFIANSILINRLNRNLMKLNETLRLTVNPKTTKKKRQGGRK